VRGVDLTGDILQDGRFTLRQLRKNPGFTCTAVLTLALGMCASIAIFAFVEAALLRPLPYREPSRLVGVYESVQMFPQSNLSYADYRDWKTLNASFDSLSAYQRSGLTLTAPGGAQRVPGARVSDDFFRTLGVAPVLGRDFRAGEDLPSAPRAVLLSYAGWQGRYGGSANVLGQSVTLNGAPHVIVGVLPRHFHFAPAEPADFWVTLHASNPCDLRRSCHNLFGVARLKDGVSIDSAATDMTAVAQQLEKAYPDSNRGQGAAVLPLQDVIVGQIRPMLIVLLSGAGLLLVIAAVNVASLLLVRSESRRREVAIRTALGASTVRVIRQFVTEALVLVALGTVLALVSAYWAVQLLTSLVPANMMAGMPFLRDLGMTPGVAAFASALAVAAAALFAITPTLQMSTADMGERLASGSRGSAGNTWRRIGPKLVVLELAAAMVLLVGAGLLGKSFYRLLRVDTGMQVDHLATLTVNAPQDGYSTNEQQAALERQIANRIALLPGVQSVGTASTPPVFGGNTMWIRVEGRPYHGEHNEVQYREVSQGYFSTLRARLLRGRDFTDDDLPSKPPVAIINQALARQYFPGEDPLGQQLLYAPTTTQPAMQIVGIVNDIKEGPLDVATRPTMYVAFAQDPTSGFAVFARTSQAERSLLPAMAAAINQLDSRLSTSRGTTMSAIINDSDAAYLRRSATALVAAFAAVAWVLGVVGLYGVVAYSVSQRTREIGVRMALGAERAAVYRLILGETARLVAFGLGIGIVTAIAAATTLRTLLFSIRTYDAGTIATVAGALAASALVASYVPARRAASVNPVEALRLD
jgi:macrolide transport system ATP-binding/permease protein